MEIDVLTLFPANVWGAGTGSLPGRKRGLVTLRDMDIREYAEDRHRTVDDTPYGGGARHGHEA